MTLKLPPRHLFNLPGARQHFQLAAPRATHRMEATCKDVDCPHYLHGWQTVVPTGSEQEQYLDHVTGRKFVKRLDGESAVFIFYPGQRCFRQHTKPLFRPPVLLHKKDWNGFRRVLESNEWHDTFDETLDGIRRERGK